jgi:hypothetical protein
MTEYITIKREVLEQAIEALEYHTAQTRPIYVTNEAITALRTALEAKDVEPVAWMSPSGAVYRTRFQAVENCEQVVTPLFTHPAAPDARKEKP